MFNWRKKTAKHIVSTNNVFASFAEKNVPQVQKNKFKFALVNYDLPLATEYLSDLETAENIVRQIPGQTFDVNEYLNAKFGWRSQRHCYDLDLDFYFGMVLSEYYVKLYSQFYLNELIIPQKFMDTESLMELVINTRFDNEFDPAKNLSIALTCCPPRNTSFEKLLTLSEREALLEKYCRYFKTEPEFLATWTQLEFLTNKYPMFPLLFEKYLPH